MAAPRKNGSEHRRGVKLTGTLAELAAHTKRPTVLLGDIARHLLDEHGKPSTRRADIMHPSELARDDWCPRRDYYRIRDARAGITPKNGAGRRFSLVTENIFATGHALHRKWQGWLEDMGVLAGRWKCLYCGHLSDIGLCPTDCPHCSEGFFEYAEVPLSAPDYLIAGHADGYIPGAFSLIEIKTIGLGTLRFDAPDLLREYTATTPDGREIPDIDLIWKNLSGPLEPHVRQANIYLWMAQKNGLDVDRMVFLYDFKPNQQVMEFTTTLDRDVIDPILAKAATVRDALDGSAPVPARAFDKTSKICAECPYFESCHEIREYPPTSDGPRAVATEPALRRRVVRRGSDEGSADRAQEIRPEAAGPAGGGDAGASGPRRRPPRRRPDGPVRPGGRVAQVRRRAARPGGDAREIGRDSTR